MKTLLIGINSKYIHSNLAIYYLKAFAKEYTEEIHLREYTINQSVEKILKEIYSEKADLLAFSCYIWNITIIKEIIGEIKKVQPEVKIWLGGPEVSYDSRLFLEDNPHVNGIMLGEGEETFNELMAHYIKGNIKLKDIKSLAYREDEQGEIITTPPRKQMDMNKVPFPYEDISKFENKIIYYESSRGCPFSCSYCLSSIDKGIRLRDIDLVKQELKFFIDNQVSQVKFIDRTFNCNKKHALEIWKFIKENDNGVTNYHFEISGDLISQEELDLLGSLRPGQVQFEIGIQSTNLETIDIIDRKMDFEKLSKVVKRLQESSNIHIHLDLIAGLPKEDYQTFSKSFNDVYALRAEQLQLGFLKVLKGSKMYRDKEKHGIITTEKPPYEVLFTNWVSYEDILKLKAIEEMVDVYYNTGQFNYSVLYLERFFKEPIDLYSSLSMEYAKKKLDQVSHSRLRRYEILLDFFREKIMDQESLGEGDYHLFEEILLYDLYLRENLKSRPKFIKNQKDYRKIHREFYNETDYKRAHSHLEYFDHDIVESSKEGRPIKKKIKVVFDYSCRDPLNKAAKTIVLARGQEEI